MKLPKEKPSLEEAYQTTTDQFTQILTMIDRYLEDFEPYREIKMKRGNDRNLGIIASFCLMVLRLTDHSLMKNWHLTYILRDIIHDQSQMLERIINKLETSAKTDDDKKDIVNMRHDWLETKKEIESMTRQFETTKHQAETAQQIANDLRKNIADFDKMKDLAKKLNDILKESGGESELE